MRQDVVFRVGARQGKIKREELYNASSAVCGNVLRFIRTFEQYIEEIRPDSTKKEMTELLREFFSDTMNLVHKEEEIELLREFLSDTVNFVHWQELQISALHILLREVLLANRAVEKPVGRGYISSRLIKVLVPDKDEYEILADVLREARAKNNRDSSMDDEDLQSRTRGETYRAQRTRTIDRDDKKLFLYQASADDKTSTPRDAGSDQKVKMEGLAQRTIESENSSNQLPTHITEPSPINGREYFSAAAHKLVFCRPDQCSLTNGYVDNNSSLISE
jgi:hypothetical protein